MDIVSLLVGVCIFAVIFVVLQKIPMDGTIKWVIQIVLALFFVLWFLRALGVWHGHL